MSLRSRRSSKGLCPANPIFRGGSAPAYVPTPGDLLLLSVAGGTDNLLISVAGGTDQLRIK